MNRAHNTAAPFAKFMQRTLKPFAHEQDAVTAAREQAADDWWHSISAHDRFALFEAASKRPHMFERRE